MYIRKAQKPPFSLVLILQPFYRIYQLSLRIKVLPSFSQTSKILYSLTLLSLCFSIWKFMIISRPQIVSKLKCYFYCRMWQNETPLCAKKRGLSIKVLQLMLFIIPLRLHITRVSSPSCLMIPVTGNENIWV